MRNRICLSAIECEAENMLLLSIQSHSQDVPGKSSFRQYRIQSVFQRNMEKNLRVNNSTGNNSSLRRIREE